MKKLIFSIATLLMLCIGIFAIPKADLPTINESASVTVADFSAVSIDTPTINHFEVTDRVTPAMEVAASPTDLATTAIGINQTNRIATVSRTNPSIPIAAATNSSPPNSADQSSEAIDRRDNDNVPLGSPKPVEATARNGSSVECRASPASR